MKPETFLEKLPRSVYVHLGLLALFAGYAFLFGPFVLLFVLLGFDPERRHTARLGQFGFRGFLTWCVWMTQERVRGHIPKEGSRDSAYVIVSNHESSLDTCLSLAFAPRPARLVSKQSNRRIPIIGLAAWASGILFLPEPALADDREVGTIGDVGATIEEAVRCIERGVSVIFFAEGSRARGKGIRRFKKGAFEVAAATGAPILPMVIVGSGVFMPVGGVVPLGPYRITIEFLAPRRIEGDVDEFRRKLRQEIAARHAEILAEPFHAPTRAEIASVPTSAPAEESLERTVTTSP